MTHQVEEEAQAAPIRRTEATVDIASTPQVARQAVAFQAGPQAARLLAEVLAEVVSQEGLLAVRQVAAIQAEDILADTGLLRDPDSSRPRSHREPPRRLDLGLWIRTLAGDGWTSLAPTTDEWQRKPTGP